MGSSAGKEKQPTEKGDSNDNVVQKKTVSPPISQSKPNGNSETVQQSERVLQKRKTENGGQEVVNNRHERPRTSKERVQMQREKTIMVPKERTPKLQRQKTSGFKREKTMGLTRQKTVLNDKALKGKKLTKTISKEHITPSTLKSGMNAILLGSTSVDLPSTAKIVRIFTSSTFKDTENERNMWMTEAYPTIKLFCQKLGYEFQVVDMRWGVRNESVDEHNGTEMCLREVQQCQRLSTGPNFVSLLSHRYGYRNLPRVIEASEFEKLVEAVDPEPKKVLLKWYRRDENSVPPVYALTQISKFLPDFLSTDSQKKREAANQFWKENDIMQDALEMAANQVLGPEDARRYVISVTEKETQMGILEAEDPESHCLWFRRRIKGIEDLEPSTIVSHYIDSTGPEEKWRKNRALLKELCDNRIPEVLPAKNIHQYEVEWKQGINSSNPDHKKYLSKMTSDFTTRMCSMIQEAIEERRKSEKGDSLIQEIINHTSFCKTKLENFHGREKAQERIKQYLKDKSSRILAIHGSSGSGKTTLMAKAVEISANSLRKTMNKTVAVAFRFVGTTPGSSNVSALLESLTKQITLIYQEDLKVSEELRELVEQFEHVLHYASAELPLVVMIDSLDQLDPANNARNLFWLPQELPPHVKLIVSTLEEDIYECFPNLQGFLPPENLFSIPKLPANDASGIVDHWLKSKGRCITKRQRQILLQAFEKCPLPLYLKMSLDEACRWNSFSPDSETVLEKTIRESINALFQRLEKSHGVLMMSRSMGYLTAARNGLSESELEDILSCDDDVLNDVYQYWKPPIRRLPPLMMARLRTDLQQYLVERGADNVTVTSWYHRQFLEAAENRYCPPNDITFLHSQLADFFDGKWANEKKPYKDKDGKNNEEIRHVMSQPLMYGDTYNLRKLNNLPYHLIHAGNVAALKEKCLCNFEFLQHKLLATSCREVIDDFDLARRSFPKEKDLELIGEAFQLSEDDVIYDPLMFPSQMIDRLADEKIVKDFVTQCKSCTHPHIRPNQEVLIKPGGQMRCAMAGHRASLKSLDLKQDGKTAVTCCEIGDDEIRTWDVTRGKLIRTYDGLGDNPFSVHYVNNDNFIMINYINVIKTINELGEVIYTVQPRSQQHSLVVGGTGNTWLGLFQEQMVELYDAKSGELKHKVSSSNMSDLNFGVDGIAVVRPSYNSNGSNNYMVVTDSTQQHISVFSLKKKSFVCTRQVFTDNENGDPYTVDAMVISADERQVCYCDCFTNDLHIADINTLKDNKVYKGNEDDYTLNYHVSKDGKSLYCVSNRDILIWDLKSGERKYTLQHSCYVIDARTVDFRTMVTITEDKVVYVWDMTRPEKKGHKEKFNVGHNVWNIITLPNSRYVAALFKKTSQSTNDFGLIVYDLVDMKIVRQANIMETPGVFELIDDEHILMNMGSSKIKIVNINTMTVAHTFQGKIPKVDDPQVCVISDHNKVVMQTKGSSHLKVYDINHEETECIIKNPLSNERIEKIYTNNKTLKVAALTDYKNIIVFNIRDKTTEVVTAADVKVDELGEIVAVASCGDNIVLTGAKSFTIHDEVTEEILGYIWNSKSGKLVAELHDKEYQINYVLKENQRGLSISVDDVMFITDTWFLTSDDDYIMRVWDINTGTLMKRLTGHESNIEMFSITDGPLFVSYGCWEEENAIKLWSTESLECIASFKLDSAFGKLRLCKDGLTFVTTEINPSRIIHWKLHGVEEIVDLSKLPKKFGGKVLEVDLDLQSVEDYEDDPNDPDTDIEVNDDDDDEEFEECDEEI
ncbi:NACHT and WD repeat domain-containing protein 2-like [Saccostrea echinata]|uniref:NACHT and WD repeat domain-containing protein 2-like n=1 Tax=Saccostrea echinata TaxID=191078 RepID=UPI002A82DEE4|nr:NACHT and WD repeat domain-containing protein 2-like [Saccostrea echinata]